MINPKAHDADAELERRIEFQQGLLATAITPDEQRSAWEEFKRLVNSRSPEQVERMEREIGVR